VRDQPKKEWLELCKQASAEPNPERLVPVVRRISDLMEASISLKL